MASALPAPAEELQRRSAGDEAALFIRRLIFDGELRPGTRVPQDEVAKRLGISRIPVREALIALEREGWVTIEMHRGAFVCALDEQTVVDHYDLYGLVYGFAVERAVERGGPDFPARLREVERAIATADDPEEAWRLAVRFHGLVVDATGSPRVRVVLRAMPGVIPGNFFELVPGAFEAEKKAFGTIARAVRRGDGAAAAGEYARMMHRQGARVVTVLRDRGLFAPHPDTAGGDRQERR
jgi:DNA-binding GntR family transcriptional regulator